MNTITDILVSNHNTYIYPNIDRQEYSHRQTRIQSYTNKNTIIDICGSNHRYLFYKPNERLEGFKLDKSMIVIKDIFIGRHIYI